MPRDIRSYFTAVPNGKTAPKPVTRSKKRPVISSDEEDLPSEVSAKRSKTIKKPNVKSTSLKSDFEEERPKKYVTPSDIFGKGPVKREPAPKASTRLQAKQEVKIHDDNDFGVTLDRVDKERAKEECVAGEEILEKEEKIKVKRDKAYDHDISEEESTAQNKSFESKGENDQKHKRKKSSTSSNDECKGEKRTKHDKNTSKQTSSKKTQKTTNNISKLEVEYTQTKKKASPQKDAPLDIYEERIEKKKQSTALYQQYLQRGGARNPGSKPIPEGAENCLIGLSFLITGVLDSLEREEAEELIKKYGGRILQQVSRKTNFVIIGDQPGPAKLAKAESLKIKKISEDDLLEMIRTKQAGNTNNIKQSNAQSTEKSKRKSKDLNDSITQSLPEESEATTKQEQDTVQSPRKKKDGLEAKYTAEKVVKKVEEADTTKTAKNVLQQDSSVMETEALVEKYRPQTMKQILGQQGDKSNVKKLYAWLKNWHGNHHGKVKHTRPSPWAKNDDGAFFKAAMLSGPPGIGKTTTAQVVCKELDFDLLEFNASDTRSKRLLQEEVSEILSNTTMKSYFTDQKAKPTAKHALLMDEVDGMAGNEDRGGLQELIALIKSTDIPIICICNDRANPKMRTLANYTFDLKFQKPRLEQIRAAMKSICYKEDIEMSMEDLDRLIESTNQDIRQVINHLALFTGTRVHQKATERKHANKDLKLGPWDVVKKVFSAVEQKGMSIHEKSDLFFHDYSIAPLFVQENYLLAVPEAPKSEILKRMAESADSLALGDVVEKTIRRDGAWSLLPLQACYSSVIPGTMMGGHIGGQINFPSWLGRNSKTNKFDRLLQEITVHARLTTGASKEAINLDYTNHLRDAITMPLVANGMEGVDNAVNVINQYHLLREDLDSLIEVSLWPGQRDAFQFVDAKVKAAFTRSYNKNCTSVPYAMHGPAPKKKTAQASQDEGFAEEDAPEENSDDGSENADADRMIKAKKPTGSNRTQPTSKKEKASKRGRGRGKPK
ncbi:hypothetical protein KM043_003328 [Ampulex compressa]|nr:hypothetical protein KM043_003328 [Ampulex compressa]